jgi:hypothetical protein
MKVRIDWLVLVAVGMCVVGCGAGKKEAVSAEEAAERAGLRRDQYSSEAKGENVIKGTDGTTTELLKVDDLGQYGLKIYPGAVAKDGDAYRKSDGRSVTVFYTLLTSDPAKNVGEFYEKELVTKGAKSGETGKIVAGKLADGRSAVVTVIDEGEKGTRAEVQILGGAEAQDNSTESGK